MRRIAVVFSSKLLLQGSSRESDCPSFGDSDFVLYVGPEKLNSRLERRSQVRVDLVVCWEPGPKESYDDRENTRAIIDALKKGLGDLGSFTQVAVLFHASSTDGSRKTQEAVLNEVFGEKRWGQRGPYSHVSGNLYYQKILAVLRDSGHVGYRTSLNALTGIVFPQPYEVALELLTAFIPVDWGLQCGDQASKWPDQVETKKKEWVEAFDSQRDTRKVDSLLTQMKTALEASNKKAFHERFAELRDEILRLSLQDA